MTTMASDQAKDSASYLKLVKLHAAMSSRMVNLKVVEKILELQGDINYKVPTTDLLKLQGSDLMGCTILHLLFRNNSEKFMQLFDLLLDHSADITSMNSKGQTVIHEFIDKIPRTNFRLPQNDPRIDCAVSAHLRFHITENPLDPNGLSHFHAACMANNVDAMNFFLDNGVSVDESVNVDSPIFAGYTPLHFSTRFVCLDAVKLLLHRGAKVDSQDAKKMTPLHLIIFNILRHGVKDAFSLEECINVIKEIKNNDKNVNAQDHLGFSHLHVLCIFKDSSMLKRHLNDIEDVNHAVNIDSPICPGFMPLHFAALFNLDSLKLLLAKGADITIKNTDEETPLDLCIARYGIEDIHDIIARSTFKNVTLSNGKTKLTNLIFSMQSPSDFNTFLRELGDENANIPVDSPLWPGYTPLHLGIYFHERCSNDKKNKKTMFYELIEECLKSGFDVSAKGILNQTPLQYAFRRGCVEAVNLMLKYHRGTSNPVDGDGLSHLHIACAAGNQDVVEALLANGADVNCKLGATFTWYFRYNFGHRVFFCPGSTPLHIAVAIGNSQMTKSLLEHNADIYARDVNGLTAVHRLVTSDCIRWLGNVLLSSSNLRECVVDSCGLSHLHVACLAGHVEAVKKLLLEPRIQIHRVITCNANDELVGGDRHDDRYGDPSVEDPLSALASLDGYTPLHMAMRSSQRSSQVVRLLVLHGADVFAESRSGSVPVYDVLSSKSYGHWRLFVSLLRENSIPRHRLKRACNVTMLHIACFGGDLHWMIEILLAKSEDVNARIRDDSAIWPGYTALHVLMSRATMIVDPQDFHNALQWLLDRGADVAISDGCNTPLHMVYTTRYPLKGIGDCARSMLWSIKDFSLNPISRVTGMSHFHIACNLFEYNVVEKFLKHGADVNSRIGSNGATPLHLALRLSEDHRTQCYTVDRLLEYGADVSAEDFSGNTLLHCAAINYVDTGQQIFNMILDAGADINAKNVKGESSLELLTEHGPIDYLGTIKEIDHFIESGCRINDFNSVTEEGLIPMIFAQNTNHKKVFKKWVLSTPNIGEVDEMGRSAIHNIVSTGSSTLSEGDYIDLIDELEKLGCDFDHQDEKGRTALHAAARFQNYSAISALLATGADINIVDAVGKTAFAYGLVSRTIYDCVGNRSERLDKKVIDLFATHVHKLQLIDLSVNESNEESHKIALEKHCKDSGTANRQHLRAILDRMEKVKIGCQSMTLRDFISGNGVALKYSKLTQADRHEMLELFESISNGNNDEKFDELKCLIKLQYRNILARSKLIDAAKLALNALANMPVPDLCSEAIFASFENWELRNVIVASPILICLLECTRAVEKFHKNRKSKIIRNFVS